MEHGLYGFNGFADETRDRNGSGAFVSPYQRSRIPWFEIRVNPSLIARSLSKLPASITGP